MNWSDLIKEIQTHGLTQSEIASEVGTSQGHISDLLSDRRGKRMGYQLGKNLVSLRTRLERKAKAA
jgi:transcriptional regulator with XRE-family HTH domain